MAQFTLDATTEVGKITLANFEEIKKDLYALLPDSQHWWPAVYGHYGS